MQRYHLTFSNTSIAYFQKGGVLFLEGQDPHKFIHPLTIANAILRDFVQGSLETTPRIDGDTGDFKLLDWEIYPADESPMGIAMWGFAFHPFAEYLLSDNSFDEAIRHARFCAWHSNLLGDGWDQQVISRYSFSLQRFEYDVVTDDVDLRKHQYWIDGRGNPRIEATIYA